MARRRYVIYHNNEGKLDDGIYNGENNIICAYRWPWIHEIYAVKPLTYETA